VSKIFLDRSKGGEDPPQGSSRNKEPDIPHDRAETDAYGCGIRGKKRARRGGVSACGTRNKH